MPTDPRPDSAAATRQADALGGLAFVLIWSTGYIAAQLALQGSGPFTLAVLRFGGAALLIGLWLLLRAAPRPARGSMLHAAIGGVLLQAGFFGFTYAGIRSGVPAAVGGLICGLMPLTTALGARVLLGEALHRKAMLGLVLGLAGALLVIAPKLQGQSHGSLGGYLCMVLALLSLSLGTLYQKRHSGPADLRLSLLIQLVMSLLVLLPFAVWQEHLQLQLQIGVIIGIAWAILMNSFAGLLLYLWLLRRGGAGRVASLFYLVPPVTAVLAAAILHARFGEQDLAGFALAALGVWLGQRA